MYFKERENWPFRLVVLYLFLIYIIWILLDAFSISLLSEICKLAFICYPVPLFLKDEVLKLSHFGDAMTDSGLWELCLSLRGRTCISRRGVWKSWNSTMTSLPRMLSSWGKNFSTRDVVSDLTTTYEYLAK